MHNQKYKTLLNNTFLLGLGTFGSKLLTFLMVRFYTGVLSPSDYGTADLIMQTANLLIPIASLGITNGVFRFALDRVSQRKTVFTGETRMRHVNVGKSVTLQNDFVRIMTIDNKNTGN